MPEQNLSDIVPRALRAQERGEPLAIATLVATRLADSAEVGTRLVIGETGSAEGSIAAALDPVLVREARAMLAEKRSGLRSFRLGNGAAEVVRPQTGDLDIYIEVLSRPPRLIIVGCGHIAVPLAQLGKLLDFEVIAIDDRAEFATDVRFPTVDRLEVGPYRETMKSQAIDGDTFIVLVTRGHVHDRACLEEVLDSGARYIGMIGSRRRVRTVMKHLAESGRDPEALERVYAPIGLDIGSQTPAEIALAVMAEIVSVRNGGSARSLRLGEHVRA